MIVYTLKRLLLALLVAIVVSAISFGLLFLSGDPAAVIAGEEASTEDVEYVKKLYGFDRPVVVQYLNWVANAIRGDFGTSYFTRRPVSQILANKLPVSLKLGLSAITLAIAMAVPLGILGASNPNSWIDRLALLLSVMGQALPSFWSSLMLIVLLGVWFPILPISGSATWRHFVMPTMVLGYFAMPAIMRLTRTGMMEVLSSDYIRTARAKGLLPGKVYFKHALRNAVIPVVSLAAVQFGFMLGGSIIVETIFALDGMGYLAWNSINRSDFPTVQAVILIYSCIYIGLTLLADLFNAWLDPRIRVA